MNPLRKYAYHTKWTIGFSTQSLSDVVEKNLPLVGFKWMKSDYKKGWFADPFILDVTESNIILLAEELYYPTGLGRISRLTIRKKDYTLLAVDPVLQLDSHLSFPAILRIENKIYFYPENFVSGKLNLYEYNVDNNSCKLVRTLCRAPLTDAIVTDVVGNSFAIYSTEGTDPNGCVLKRFQEDGTVLNTYSFPNKIARNAGNWFQLGGKIYRPAQDCNDCYGAAVILQQVSVKNKNELVFKDMRRIESDNDDYNLGCHTFNHYKGVIVIDAKAYRRPIAHAIYECLYNIKRKILG